MHPGESARTVLRLGSFVFGVAVLAGLWEMLADQAPGSPLFVGMLPAPIERLRSDALIFGMLLWLGAFSLGEQTLADRVLACLWVGGVMLLGSELYAAMNGMPGMQLQDLRADAPWVFFGKLIGRGLLVVGLVEIAWRATQQNQQNT
jgi:hypothetical protein